MSHFGASTNDWFGKSEFADPLLDGSYDTLFFYNRALSGSEIQVLSTLPGVVP